MSWEETHKGHDVWQALRELAEALRAAITNGDIDITEARVRRLKSVVHLALGFEEYPHALITSVALNRVRDRAQAITDALPSAEGVFGTPSASSPSKFTSLVNELRQWPQKGSANLRSLTKQVEQLDSLVEDLKEHASEAHAAVRSEADEHAATIRSESSRLIEEIRNEVQALRDELGTSSEQLAELGRSISDEKTRIDDANRAHQESFEQDQAERKMRFQEWLDETDAVREASEESAKTQAQDLIQHLKDAQTKADTILGVVGERSIATDYGRWADKQKFRATAWSIAAVMCFLIAGGVFAASVFDWFDSRPLDGAASALWQHTAAHFGMTAVLLAAAVFSSTRSNQHWQEEKDAKARQLVLATMEPYLVNLEEGDRREVRQEAARAMFVVQRDKDEKRKKFSIRGPSPGQRPWD